MKMTRGEKVWWLVVTPGIVVVLLFYPVCVELAGKCT